jgi:hypothetical protein
MTSKTNQNRRLACYLVDIFFTLIFLFVIMYFNVVLA